MRLIVAVAAGFGLLSFTACSETPQESQKSQVARVPDLDMGAGLVFSDETHTITAALDGQGIALMSKALIADELARGRLVQPFGPDLHAKPFHLVYPEERLREPAIAAVREWVLGLR